MMDVQISTQAQGVQPFMFTSILKPGRGVCSPRGVHANDILELHSGCEVDIHYHILTVRILWKCIALLQIPYAGIRVVVQSFNDCIKNRLTVGKF